MAGRKKARRRTSKREGVPGVRERDLPSSEPFSGGDLAKSADVGDPAVAAAPVIEPDIEAEMAVIGAAGGTLPPEPKPPVVSPNPTSSTVAQARPAAGVPELMPHPVVDRNREPADARFRRRRKAIGTRRERKRQELKRLGY